MNQPRVLLNPRITLCLCACCLGQVQLTEAPKSFVKKEADGLCASFCAESHRLQSEEFDRWDAVCALELLVLCQDITHHEKDFRVWHT